MVAFISLQANHNNDWQFSALIAFSPSPHYLYTAIEIGFTRQRIYHTELIFYQFHILINKSLESEQTFPLLIESSTLLSGVGQRATRGEDFDIGRGSFVRRQLSPSKSFIHFAYLIHGDNTPEDQEVFQLSITPANGSPAFGCSVINGCYQQIEIVIIDDDGE